MKTLRIIAVNFLLTILFFALIEVGCRLAYPDVGLPGTDSRLIRDSVYYDTPGLSPGVTGISNGAEKEVNEHGFLAYDGNKLATEDATSWLFLGDSVTFGIGVVNDSTFAGRFSLAYPNIRVDNPSVIGHSVYDYSNILRKLTSLNQLREYNRVFIFWTLNDLYGNFPIEENPTAIHKTFLTSLISFFRDNTIIYHILKKQFADRPEAYFKYDQQFYESGNEFFVKGVKQLTEIRNLTEQASVPLTIVLLPYEYQLRLQNNESRFRPQQLMKSNLTKKITFDVAQFLKKPDLAEASDLYLFGDGIHFSSLGHKRIHEYLSRTIITNRYR